MNQLVESCIKLFRKTGHTSHCLLCRGLSTKSSQSRLRVLFYGSDEFSLESLKLLKDNHRLHDGHANKLVSHLSVISGVSMAIIMSPHVIIT